MLIVSIDPEPQHIKMLGQVRDSLGFRPSLVAFEWFRIEMVLPDLEKHDVSPPAEVCLFIQ